jgi:hypothetical protein
MNSKAPFRRSTRPPFRTPLALSELANRLKELENAQRKQAEILDYIKKTLDALTKIK